MGLRTKLMTEIVGYSKTKVLPGTKQKCYRAVELLEFDEKKGKVAVW